MGSLPGEPSDHHIDELLERLESDEGLREKFRAWFEENDEPVVQRSSRRDQKKKPWDQGPYEGDIEWYRGDLYDGLQIPTLGEDLPGYAKGWLEELARTGYRGMVTTVFDRGPVLRLPLKQKVDNHDPVSKPLSEHGNAYPVFFNRNRQVLWLQPRGKRSESGYLDIAVAEEPLRTDKAILAALTSLEGQTMDVDRLRRALQELKLTPEEPMWKQSLDAVERFPRGQRPEAVTNLQNHKAIDYVLMLLRYHRPNFDNLSHEEKAWLVEQSCSRINEFLESLRKLMTLLEYGSPNRDTRMAVENAGRDIKAAVLKDVDQLSLSQIRRELGEPQKTKNPDDVSAVSKMVVRGRGILENAWGKEGWREKSKAMRIEAERWNKLSEAEREAEEEAELKGISVKDVHRRFDEWHAWGEDL